METNGTIDGIKVKFEVIKPGEIIKQKEKLGNEDLEFLKTLKPNQLIGYFGILLGLALGEMLINALEE